MSFERFAVYFVPAPGSRLNDFGRSWLGVDINCGELLRASSEAIARPRRYGFHATLRAPMRLRPGATQEEFVGAAKGVADRYSPLSLGHLRVRKLGNFIALVPEAGENHDVSELAFP